MRYSEQQMILILRGGGIHKQADTMLGDPHNLARGITVGERGIGPRHAATQEDLDLEYAKRHREEAAEEGLKTAKAESKGTFGWNSFDRDNVTAARGDRYRTEQNNNKYRAERSKMTAGDGFNSTMGGVADWVIKTFAPKDQAGAWRDNYIKHRSLWNAGAVGAAGLGAYGLLSGFGGDDEDDENGKKKQGSGSGLSSWITPLALLGAGAGGYYLWNKYDKSPGAWVNRTLSGIKGWFTPDKK